jgi:murein DD-endopeptidase MepM/ murein hydrolase activator NlpD
MPTGTRITSPFGERIHPVTGARKMHDGVDLAAETGTTLNAPAAGRVLHVGEDGVSGNYVVLDHGHGVQSVSCHLQEALLKRGADAEAGAAYARSGASGRVTGPHLHYGVRVGGRFVDPVASSRRAPPPPRPPATR